MDNSIQAHQKELCYKLWAMANALRGNMDEYAGHNGARRPRKWCSQTA